MKETYTVKEAMERLGVKGVKAFHHMESKYPEAFVIVNQGTAGDKQTLYDKATLDRFADAREYFKRERQ
jgi:hypothetical protein